MNKIKSNKLGKLSFFLLAISLTGLSTPIAFAKLDGTPSRKNIDFNAIPDAVPKVEPKSKKGPSSYVIKGKRYYVLKTAEGYSKKGEASWYGTYFHGKKTASGTTFNTYEMTAASPDLPLNTYLKVKNLDNGKEVIVKVTDRGPYAKGHDKKPRILDLSFAAAMKLDYANKGHANIQVTAIDPVKWASEHSSQQA